MKSNSSIKMNLVVEIVALFIISSVTPIVFGYNVRTSNEESTVVNDSYDRYMNPEFYDCYNVDEIPSYVEYQNYDESTNQRNSESEITNSEKTIQHLDAPMDSPWPMYCHDVRHTGRSPYSTIDTWDEIWRFWMSGPAYSPVINIDGVIYIGGRDLYAVYPNGTKKWNYDTGGIIQTCPAIDKDGVIYTGTTYGTYGDYLYAIYTINGTLKWKYEVPNVFSSPTIGNDGTIYFGDSDNWYIKALYPNGTLKWAYKTDLVVYSSPALGLDGTVYCGSHDTYLYALYPNNGTLKWKYKTGDWIRTSPCVADDGTIYCVSLDGYLYAIYHNGTLKWKTDVGAGTSPTISQDGTIYCGYDKFYALNPTDGSVKWTFDVGGTMRGGTPCNSVDGTIYVGTSDGGEILAINPDGTLKWRYGIGECESAPAIGEDGTVYVGSSVDDGYLHAFGIGELEADANGPYYGLINKLVQFKGYSRGGYSPHSYHWDFGDGESSDEQNPTHIYTSAGNYTVTLTVTDNTGNTSTDTTWAWIQVTNTPPNKPTIDGPTSGVPWTSYPYTFSAADPDGTPIYLYIDWDDNTNSGWVGPYSSGEEVTRSHTWTDTGTCTIKAKAKDPYEAEGPWETLEVVMPRNRATYNTLFLQLLERFPSAFPILRQLLGL